MVTLEYKIRMPLDLQMFAKEGPGGEKTEDATSKKLEDVRKEGNVAKSAEVSTAATLLALYVCLKFTIGFVGNRLMSTFEHFYRLVGRFISEGINSRGFRFLMLQGILDIVITIAPFLLLGFLIAFLSNALQFQFKVTTKPLQPKFSKMNPVNGIKRMFSLNTLVELLKSVVKIVMI